MPPTRYLFVSTPVGAIGSGIGGGVELNVMNLARQLVDRGDEVHIIAPESSQTGTIPVTTVAGCPPDFAQASERRSPVQLPLPSTLANLWDAARQLAPKFDLTVNWAYDWLPLYLTPFIDAPVVHIISMGSLNDGIDAQISQLRRTHPGTIAVHSRAQAATFPDVPEAPFAILPCGIDLTQYDFVSQASASLCWVGRIAPEKGLEDCAALSEILQVPITILGKMQDSDYWDDVRSRFPQAQFDYRGFLPTAELQQIVGRSRALVMTPKWIEAFGMVAVEALACGVPVVTYDRGGPAEIVESGVSGWVVPADDIHALAAAVENSDRIDRQACRDRAVTHYSLAVMHARFKQWSTPLLVRDTRDR
ncbi:MAG: glycosyltransferase [Cyanobacteria bacterium J06648_11]